MLESLKKKAFKALLPAIIILAVIVLFLAVLVLPSVFTMIKGPEVFDPYTDQDQSEIVGKYVTVTVTNLIDWYAETVEESSDGDTETKAREYIMPVYGPNDSVFYIGVEVSASMIEEAELVMQDTQNALSDESGTYQRDDSYLIVTGTIEYMDEETQYLWREYLDTVGADSTDDKTFPPIVIVQGNVGSNFGSGEFIVLSVLCLAVLVLLVWFVVRAATGGSLKQIKKVIAASNDPEGTEHALDLFCEDTQPDEYGLRISRSWLLYAKGAAAWVVPGESVTWIYTRVVKQKMYGIITIGKTWSVVVNTDAADKKDRRHEISVRNEDAARAVVDKLSGVYPDAVCGYDAALAGEYDRDPAAFRAKARAARAAAAAQQETTAANAEIEAAPEA